MLSTEEASKLISLRVSSADDPEVNAFLSAQDIKHCKDRINSLRNIFPFYGNTKVQSLYLKEGHPAAGVHLTKEELSQAVEEDKDTCEKSDSEGVQNDPRPTSFVHSRIASYELPYIIRAQRKDRPNSQVEGNDENSCKPSNSKFSAFKERYQKSLGNYEPTNENSGKSETSEGEIPSTSKADLNFRLSYDNDSLESSKNSSNVIFGNKDILKLLSNKHLANLNIRVERNTSFKKDVKWRENLGSFRASKSGIRSSFRSSKRRRNVNKNPSRSHVSKEEKGTSDSTLKENESETDSDYISRGVNHGTNLDANKKMPEYAKVSKRRVSPSNSETPPSRSSSVSPAEGAGTENRLLVNSSSSKGLKATCKNSLKPSKESSDQNRVRRKDSKNTKKSEYRVSVTIRQSTVASLANKFNTIISQNQSGNQSDLQLEDQVKKYYSSPKASFKRKYRHKAAKAVKESKEKDSAKAKPEVAASSRGSLSNSLSELNMKDLFEDFDYNKTDEEKVCEKLKTALSSKFKGETDDSEDDLSTRVLKTDEDLLADDEGRSDDTPPGEELYCKSESVDSGIFADDEKSNTDGGKIILIVTGSTEQSPSTNDETCSLSNEYLCDSDPSTLPDSSGYFESLISESSEMNVDCDNVKTQLEERKSKDDSFSEASSIGSDVKARKGEKGIYTSLKAVVKNTVKKTKEKDSERKSNSKEEKKERKKKRTCSKERDKWYKRSCSRERKEIGMEEKAIENKKEKRLYEKWTFRRKSKEEGAPSLLQDDPYSKVLFGSRSRSREKRCHQPRKSNSKPESLTPDGDVDEKILESELNKNPGRAENEERSQEAPPGLKVIPPPPKEPVPSPPNTLQKLLFGNRVKRKTEEGSISEDIYENLFASDLKQMKLHREKLEGEGIVPNASFLWRDAVLMCQQRPFEKTPEKRTTEEDENPGNDSNVGYDQIGPSSLGKPAEDSGSDGHNYTEIQNNSSGDSQTVAYDEITAPSVVSYDDIRLPPSAEDLYNPPSEGYDPVNPPKSDSSQYDECDGAIVTAEVADVDKRREFLSYSYDDVAMYNISLASHSYEPVCPPDDGRSLIVVDSSSATSAPPPETAASMEKETSHYSDDSYGPHDVFSYKLTQVPGTSEGTIQPPLIEGSSLKATASLYGSLKKSLYKLQPDKERSQKDEDKGKVPGERKRNPKSCHAGTWHPIRSAKDGTQWEDISDSDGTEKDEMPVTFTTSLPIARKHRPRRAPRFRVAKKSWTQGVRDVAANGCLPNPQNRKGSLSKVHLHHSRTHVLHPKLNYRLSDEGDNVITKSWRPKLPVVPLNWGAPPPRPPGAKMTRTLVDSPADASHLPSADLDGILRWQNSPDSGPARTPSKLSTASSSSSTSSSPSIKSSSSSYSSISSSSSFILPGTCGSWNSDEKIEDQVYVSSASTIIIISAEGEPLQSANLYDTPSLYYNASNVSSCGTQDYESAKIRSIFYEDNASELQEISCYVEGNDCEDDDEGGGHYEAIYEVITPAEEAIGEEKSPEEYLREESDEGGLIPDDDSFDSDDSDEAYSRLLPQYFEEEKNDGSRDRNESFSSDASTDKGDHFSQHKYGRSNSHQQQSITKLAEAANIGMKRLRRNWSLTKNEVKTGLNKIKRKSAFVRGEVKSTEDILNEVQASGIEKAKWSLKSRFRRKSTSSVLPSSGGKDKATFYLTLTISPDKRDSEEQQLGRERSRGSNLERRNSSTPSVSSVTTTTSCETTVSSKSKPPSLLRNTSTGSNSGCLLRPKTAPPAPPKDSMEDTSGEISKDALALRLNQILSCGPVAPPGRRVLRTSECYGSESLPFSLFPTEEKVPPSGGSKTPLAAPTEFKARTLPSEVAESIKQNFPQARISVASSSSSNGSSEGYIRPSDIVSAPPPLPARPSNILGINNNMFLKREMRSHLSQSHPNISLPKLIFGTTDIDSRSYLDLSKESPQKLQEEPSYMMTSHFPDEPLYQFYTAKVERAALYQGDSSEDDYEVINDGGQSTSETVPSRPSAMELVTPTDGRRTLWCELPEVLNSGILGKINSQERKIQEAMFEVITSEASYLKSLEVLVSHFMNHQEFCRLDDPVISRREHNILFSDILPVKRCSEMFLVDLENRWQESFRISGLSDVVLKHSTSSFNVYVKYCSNQIYQDRILKNLRENNSRFVEVLSHLESSPVCQSLAMHSFLMLPMQRITRLPLLLDAIFNRLEYGSSQWLECKSALASLTKIVAECNEGARKMERMEEMLLVSHQLDFREVKAIPLISASRWLVKKGELTRLTWKDGDGGKLTFGRKILKHSLYFFLFTDLLVVTKRKSEDQQMVLDYCPRNMVQVLELESADKFPGRLLDGHKNLIIMTMLQNHENKTVEMVLSCSLESDRTRWMEAVTPRISENPDERIYEEWDCPQVQVVHAYVATQPDEVSLEVSEVLNVLKKTSDGWYQGEKLRDGSRGWFPGNHTVEIASAHVRARNLRQRYRLLAISGSIVDELQREKERCEKSEKKKERRKTVPIREVF